MRRGGFSLMEVMVAMAILAAALLGLSLSISRSVSTSNHARLMTQATFLCRQQLVELEQGFVVDGFTDDAGGREERDRPFEEEPFKRFRWGYKIDKIQLPSVDQIQSAATKALEGSQQIEGGEKPRAPAGGGGGGNKEATGAGMIGGLIGPVKQTLEQAIRRVTVSVWWDEPGRPGQVVEVVAYYTDMRRVQGL